MTSRSYAAQMKAPAFVLMLAVMITAMLPAQAATVDVVVQAGHEGRPASCARFHVPHCYLGASSGTPEGTLTAIVADATAAALRSAGLTVARRPADYAGTDTARAAVFLHFDGSAPACRSGASVGFPPGTDRAFIDAWETAYRAWFPFRFVGENFTVHEAQYYDFRKVTSTNKRLLIEFGEVTCPAQRAWLMPRLHELGNRVAAFLIAQLRP
jgi:hypothetical protein